MQLKSKSLDQTAQIAALVAKEIPQTPCLLLRGGLGAGKTTFSKYLIHYLTGTPLEEITSPTYSYVHVYDKKLAHFDLYRVPSQDYLEELGLIELLSDPCVIKIIEWPDIALSLLPANRLEITIDSSDSEERGFSFSFPLVKQDCRV
ncbi:MAG: tRNA (adenosine(37)-N6)-threonylcarbamoyltransferase complex ATPase subunit type 1 TsaE [Chlamydiae bacterium]|jgi:tRNA threonylcarbamoyladenosine biosynthesis protein TsaE|nr:tRNA (adenosine(37)-N6)-threonylcarbamoyltransferase complex ATPase subunit type 1 TsaE [Chlamydiota bacterium]